MVSWLGLRILQVSYVYFFSIFFNLLFFNFIIKYWVGGELNFIFFLFLGLLTRFDPSLFFKKKKIYLLALVWVWIKLCIFIFLFLLSMALLMSCDTSRRLGRLTLYFFFFLVIFFLFHHSMLVLLRIKLYNLFQFVFYEAIPVS
jgi:hypothetical protein